jgi:hypothetical protein
MRYSLIFTLTFLLHLILSAQDSLLLEMAKENQLSMRYDNGLFSGPGWEAVRSKAKDSDHVLIGEDHFTVEIPKFIEAIGLDSKYDNFYIEIDPYSTAIIQKTFTWTDQKRAEFYKKYGRIYSFYALREEYALLEKMVKSGMNLLGSDQIVMFDDRLIFQDLAQKTKNLNAKKTYESVAEKSKAHLDKFLQNPQNPMYFMTPAFGEDLSRLGEMELSEIEYDILEKMRISVDIYQKQSHRIRVQLIKHHLMNDYAKWKNKRNLFKYGANHMARGESFLTVTDIGNLVANIAEANYQESFHIMILGESGMQATAFETFPPSEINPNGFYLKHLQPFFQLTEGADWAVFDLIPIRKALERGTLILDNQNLIRSIKGFDVLILIPEVTAAGFD